jgi:hypothetical protein
MVTQTNKTATLRDQLNEWKMPSARHTDLSLLNGYLLTDSVEKGTMIKIFSGHY